MTRSEFEEKNFDEIMRWAVSELNEVTDYESLKEFAKQQINEDNHFLAIHILQAIDNRHTGYYLYDYCMGTLQTPETITEIEDIAHLL